MKGADILSNFNTRVKVEMTKHGIRQYELAKILGIHENKMSVMLNRGELPKKKQDEIIAEIKKYKRGDQ